MKSANPARLSGKTVVITGASSGVGRTAAIAFARTGARLVLAARREEALESLRRECEALGATAIAVPTDVTDYGEMEGLAGAAAEFGGRIDVWVNNAGVLAAGPFDETPVEVHNRVIQTNLMGYIHGAHAVLPYFKRQGQGILINNISIGGYVPVPYAGGYSASKFGLRGFSGSLRAELSRYPHIHVCDLYPAFLDTPGIQHAANYTGAKLKAAPPVFPPEKVAKAMVRIALRPKAHTMVDPASPVFRLAYGLFPGLVGKIAEIGMRTYFRKAKPEAADSGNLYDDNTPFITAHGGWLAPQRKLIIVGGLLLAAILIGFSGSDDPADA